jgi:hypothetical protein
MKNFYRFRYLIFILLGVFVLLFKRYYTGPCAELINNHGSNFSVSFAVYFIARLGLRDLPYAKLLSVTGSLLAVELFELTNGFGFMSNIYDPWDYLANALGVTLAVGIDLLIKQLPQE